MFGGGVKFNPAKDIPDLTGKVVVVTGGNSGLGLSTVKAYAAHGPRIFLTSRSIERGQAAINEVKTTHPKADVELVQLDLANFDSVTAAAQKINADTDRLDILILNGGISSVEVGLKEGYENAFATNHMGHALFTQLLMPTLLKTTKLPGADVRCVAVSSEGQRLFAPKEGIVYDKLKTPMESYSGMALYGQSKLANALFALQLSREYKDITSASVHPGFVATSIWHGEKTMNKYVMSFMRGVVSIFAATSDEGAHNQLWASVSPDVISGRYYEPVAKLDKDGKWSKDPVAAERLWKWTNEELATKRGTSWPAAAA